MPSSSSCSPSSSSSLLSPSSFLSSSSLSNSSSLSSFPRRRRRPPPHLHLVRITASPPLHSPQHQRGVIHGDIKSTNVILVRDGTATGGGDAGSGVGGSGGGSDGYGYIAKLCDYGTANLRGVRNAHNIRMALAGNAKRLAVNTRWGGDDVMCEREGEGGEGLVGRAPRGGVGG